MGMENEKGPRADRLGTGTEVSADYLRGRADAAAAVTAYMTATHRHVGMIKCWPETGDRCDITAALRTAAKLARGDQ